MTKMLQTCAVKECSTNTSHFIVGPVDVPVNRVIVDGNRMSDIADVKNDISVVGRI